MKIFHLELLKPLEIEIEIANDGIEDLRHITTTPLKKNPTPETVINVYSYNFRTMCILGYIAIMKNPMIKKWVLKSLHHSDDANNSLADALERALLSNKRR